MSPHFIESDWKAFGRFKDRMLEALTARSNLEAAAILNSPESTETEKYYRLFDHVRKSDRVVAECFDGWKRSSLAIFASNLLREDLVPEELWESLSESARAALEVLREIRDS